MRLASPRALPLLTDTEARAVRDTVFAHRDAWVNLEDQVYVLGCPSHKDPERYRTRAAEINPLLRQHFGGLYERLQRALTPLLQECYAGEVVFEGGYALPGFHIMLVSDTTGDPRGILQSPHWDWHVLWIDWTPELPSALKLDAFVSFTLPVSLPPGGGGLLVWESLTSPRVFRYQEEHDLDFGQAVHRLVQGVEPTIHRYAIGSLAVHTGHQVHQLAPWEPRPGDERVTLQGHALFNGGKWQVFW